MSGNNYVNKIAMVGAGGRSGEHIAKAILATGKHSLTAITRADSTSSLPEGAVAAKVNYDDHQSLVEAMKGHDVLLITMSVQAPQGQQSKLIAAAGDAGISWIVPNEYGYADRANTDAGKDVFLGPRCMAARQQIEALPNKPSWIAICCGFWYEYSLALAPAYGVDFKNKAVTFYDDGETKINTSTFNRVAEGVAALLSLPVVRENENDKTPCLTDFKNGPCRVSSFYVSQKDMFASALRVTGTKQDEWKVSYQPAKERFEEGQKELKEGNRIGYAKLLYGRCFYKDGNGTFEDRKHNDLLGLQDEDLDEATKIAVDRAEKGII